MANTPRPLEGKRIVVTRPRAQAEEFAAQLEGLGAQVFEFPTIAIAPSFETFPADSLPYDWLILTSANAADAFFDAAASRSAAPAQAAANVAVIGPATAAVVAGEGLHVRVMPAGHAAEDLFAALEAAEPKLAGKRVLMPRSDLARDFLPNALRARGACVTEWIAYRTVCPEVSREEVAALLEFAPDVVTFASSSAASNFHRILGPQAMAAIAERAVFASIGPQTSRTAQGLGVTIAIEPAAHTAGGLAAAIAAALNPKRDAGEGT